LPWVIRVPGLLPFSFNAAAHQYLFFGFGSGNEAGLSATVSVIVSFDRHGRGLRLM
jgi:hypothetical protein